MKANQKFMEADNAVSPVIGVILMVAITVVLAAVVFVLVSDLGDTKDSAPVISFSKTGDELRVISADEEADWEDIRINHDCTSVTLSGSASASFATGATGPADSPVAAGDRLTVDSPAAGCEITLLHVPTNQLYDSWNFA